MGNLQDFSETNITGCFLLKMERFLGEYFYKKTKRVVKSTKPNRGSLAALCRSDDRAFYFRANSCCLYLPSEFVLKNVLTKVGYVDTRD